MTHGTFSGYAYHGCRCKKCVTFRREYQAEAKPRLNAKYADLPKPPQWENMPPLPTLLEWAWAVHEKRSEAGKRAAKLFTNR